MNDTTRVPGAPDAAGAPDGFSPYYLYRRGTLGPSELAALTPARTWALLAEAEETRQRREELRGRLEDALHAAVPELPADRRHELLRLRRDIHNDRVPGVPDAARLLDPASRELLEDWLRHRAEGNRLHKEAEAALAAELDAGRRALAAIATGEFFQRGLQLSDERTWRTVTEWAADPFSARRKPSKRRRAENTLTSFAYRVALKPSPFASFTEIGAAPWTPAGDGTAPAAPADRPPARPVQARLSAGLLSWMTYELHRLDRADELMRIRLNHSLLVREEQALCVRRAPDGAPEAAYGTAQVVTARDTGLLRLLRSLLADGGLPERELRERLTAAGLSPQAAATALDKLVRAGICERGLGIPDQHPRPALAVAQRLRTLDTDQAGRCAVVFERLQAAEDAFPAAPVRRRAALLAEIREQVAVFVEAVGCRAPAPEAMRSVVYEDVGTREPAHSWHPDLLHANRWALELFQRIVPVLDDASVEKAGLYAFFARHFGAADGDGDVPFIEFYRRFAALPPAEASAVASGVGDPHSDRIRRLRADFADLLRTELRAHDSAPPGALRLDAERLRAFADRLPAEVAPWRSTAYRMQFTAEPERPYAVVNGVTTGHGVFFSRFCDLLEPDGPHEWSLTEALRGHIARTTPRQCDITAVLGLNFNLHPRLSPYELVYPGSVPRAADEHTLTLADLAVRADPARRTLALVSARDGQPLDLVPLNFLYPAAAPGLYRLLCAFAPTRTYRGGLWDQLDRADAEAGRAAGRTGVPAVHRSLPRVLLGDLVLDRASWRLPAADVPDPDGLERQEAAALASFDRWLGQRGIPRHTFFRLTTPPPVPAGERDLLAETRQWALEARTARLHKPHYLDARNPFLLQVFARRLAEAGPDATVTFQECLPHAGDLDGRTSGAEEFFVEYTLGTPAPAGTQATEDAHARP
ncbi:lantibiotic dehydratase [Streptomyces griseosporeus]|uniref:lantibiotic dehydratase n=1 Tax=Streptomyces griseosporeus TaxID=1910 RepID=UPI0037BDD0DB